MVNAGTVRRQGRICQKTHRKLRQMAFARDGGFCSSCNLDCSKIDAVIRHFADTEGAEAARNFADLLGVIHLTSWHIHHKIPLSKGGDNSPQNIVTLCQWCHAAEHGLLWGSPLRAREVANLEIVFH